MARDVLQVGVAVLELRGFDRYRYRSNDRAGPVVDRRGQRRGPQLELLDLNDQAVHLGGVQLGLQLLTVRDVRWIRAENTRSHE